ncbi:RNA polymerase subunit sigma-24 [Putridiphycobacter roseus]|uniref:RNA polymerase subunit sigma-24 n=1 Tax=Putridiphycobacter roseus TaxID=2219161 RepID=A0A2W1N326_9FLAO|nr:RNA polymerase sigma factor [Putridiphycobacter roseus]PZE17411.1 RNA polymerase subunit sigma-24 [Putridiphycobacter roseus]
MHHKEVKFKEIYKQSKDKIYRLCLGFSGNKAEADDLFQEVYIKVWNNLSSFRKESNINTWIYRIATNTAILSANKSAKTRARMDQLKLENEFLTLDNSGPDYAEKEIMKLYKVIATLKEQDRIIISLFLEQHSYIEIAEIVGISVSNVGVKINRIKKSLTKKMNSYGK